jgi:hypothetical protein
MVEKIDKKIVGQKIVDKQPVDVQEVKEEQKVLTMHEGIKRPFVLHGSTYKIKPPNEEHALYITINDIVLNEGTLQAQWYPYEMFLNSKNMENFQWIVSLTRVISAVFRKGGEFKFLVDELKFIFDPKGGYFKKSHFIPSVVAEIGEVLEFHLKRTNTETELKITEDEIFKDNFPDDCSLCLKCHVKAVRVLDGCMTCLNCGDSKCS